MAERFLMSLVGVTGRLYSSAWELNNQQGPGELPGSWRGTLWTQSACRWPLHGLRLRELDISLVAAALRDGSPRRPRQKLPSLSWLWSSAGTDSPTPFAEAATPALT